MAGSNSGTIKLIIDSREDYAPWVSDHAVKVFEALGIADTMQFMKAGREAVVFDTGFGQVAKVRRWEGIDFHHSPMTVEPVENIRLGPEYSVLIAPKLTVKGESLYHQAVLRMELWARGLDFFDVLPPPSDSKIIKNIRLIAASTYEDDADIPTIDGKIITPIHPGAIVENAEGKRVNKYAGLPYVIDESAVKIDPDFGRKVDGASIVRPKEGFRHVHLHETYSDDPHRIGGKMLEDIFKHSFDWPNQWDIFKKEILNRGVEINWDTIRDVQQSAVNKARLYKLGADKLVGQDNLPSR